MQTDPKAALLRCSTLMLDMDGTLLDLAFDNYMWLELIPGEYARRHDLAQEVAREELYAHFRRMQGTLDWYCLDHWSERLDLDILALHRQQHERIGYLPGAKEFLQTVAGQGIRLLLVTNSHQGTLALKAEVTGVDRFFDRIYTSHELGHAKEDQSFWKALQEAEAFDPETTLFVDDNVSVLQSARTWGIRDLLNITRPDTGRPAQAVPGFSGIERVADMLEAAG